LKNYSKISLFLTSLLSLFIVVSCSSFEEKNPIKTNENIAKYLPIKHAKGFVIEEKLNHKIITLNGAWRGDETTYQYVLYKGKKPNGYPNATFIKVPIQTIACMSLTHIAFIEELNQINSIVALSGCDYVSSKKIKQKIDAGKIKEIGQYQSLNYELLLDEKPSILMAFGINESSNNGINKLKELGLTIVLNGEHMEPHPLGKVEWIKFVAAFYDLDELAEGVFEEIEKKYLALTALTKAVKKRPTVFVSLPFNGAWYAPGGATFTAQLFKDAGANYLWGNNEERGSFVKAKEVVLDEAFYADFWLNQSSAQSLSDILNVDEKFQNFKAVKEKNLFNYNKRLNTSGGNDYWESGVVNPHIVLKDLIEIFHPELIDHELFYYQKLE